ncbi:AAA family ATPase [Neobacillus bataviensis]|uniref:AAA family ATPase n=1 Tax=Neobacillus bataviensis TaxID=220685 RepID=UPI001CBF74A2|nr:AAA family ATPase [Neobacillus bataviensis]
MMINWVYFSDTNIPPGEIQTLLEKKQCPLSATNELDKLHALLNENNHTVLFIKAHTLYNVYEFSQEIAARYPHVYIILITPDNMENLKKAMLMGASDALRASFTTKELSETINHAIKFMEHRTSMVNTFDHLRKEKSRVITVASPKGGVGKTVLTVNLAAALARTGKKVAVIDGNLQFGEVAMYYNTKPKKTIYEWVKEGYGRSIYSIDQYMTLVDGDVSILAAPPRPEFFEGISENHMKEAIESAKEAFDVVLIDLPVHLSDIHLRCLALSDEILLLTLNEISVLRLSQLYLETLDTINLKDKAKLILNRHMKGQGLEQKKIEEILGVKVYFTLPDQSKITSASIKVGQPFILSNSRSVIGKAVWNLSEELYKQQINELTELKKSKKRLLIGNWGVR